MCTVLMFCMMSVFGYPVNDLESAASGDGKKTFFIVLTFK